MAIQNIIGVSYQSSLVNINLLYDISYDDALTKRPLIVLMHGFGDTRVAVVQAWKERLITNYSVVCLVVDMRGRTTSEGHEDCNGRELYDIYDAIQNALQNYSNRIDETNINIIGYSGGGGNVFKMVCAFPDLFGVACSFFGISDYGYDNPDGWWHTTPARRAQLEDWIGSSPAVLSDNYYIRGGVFFLNNAQYSRCRTYHDLQDAGVPPINSQNVETEITALGYTNWVFDYTDIGDPIRWIHGYPIVANPGEPCIQAEATIFGEINGETYKNPSITNLGSLLIPGNLKTKFFGVWLNNGWNDAGTVDYDIEADKYTIRNNIITLNNDVYVTLEIYNKEPNRFYSVNIDSVNYQFYSDENGTLRIYTQFDANESIEIIIIGLLYIGGIIMPTVVFGEIGGEAIGGDHKDAYISEGLTGNAQPQLNVLWIRGFLTARFIPILRFSLDGHIPTNAIVTSAVLTVILAVNSGGALIVEARNLLTAWGVDPITEGANENPATAGQGTYRRSIDFNGAGGDVVWAGGGNFSANDYDAPEDTFNIGVGDLAGQVYNINIPIMTQAWVANDNNNFGLTLIESSGVNLFNRFHSQEAVLAANRPYLTVNYIIPVPIPTPEPSVSEVKRILNQYKMFERNF